LDKEVKAIISSSNSCEASTVVGEIIAKRSIKNYLSTML
jgi:hypothetical protein